jgi:hypothetical protein
LTALSLGLAFRLPLLEGLNTLPILRLANPVRLRCVASFGLAVLAGFGVATLLTTEPDVRRRAERLWRRVAAVVVALGALALVGGAVLLPRAQGWILTVGRRQVEAKYATLEAPAKPLGAFLADLEGLVGGMIAAYRPTHLAMYAPALWALAGGALILATRSRLRARGAALVVVATLDLFAFGRGYNPSVPLAEAYPRPAGLTGLGASEPPAPRFTAVQQAMLPDVHLFFGLDDIRGMDFPLRWYDAYLRLAPDWVPWVAYGVLLRGVDSPLLRVLNVGRVVAQEGDLAARPGLEVRPAGAVVVGRVLEPWPRSFVVHAAVVARDDREAARLLAADPAAVYRRVVLSDGAAPARLSLPAGDVVRRPVRALRYEPERTAWAVADGAAGYLVSTDSYYPGWRAYLDGRPTALHRANLAFRAVPVPPGRHVVEFRYEPWSVRLGIAVSLLATMVVAWLLWSARRAGAAT